VVAAGVAAIGILQVSMVARRMAVAGFRVVYAASDYPVGAVRFLERAGISGNLALPLDWGGYVLWHCSPKIRVSIDGRFVTVYPQSAIAATFDYFGSGPKGAATRLIDAYPTSLVLAPAGKSHPVRRRSGWRVVYRDRVAELFARGEGREPSVVSGAVPRGLMTFP